MDRSFSVSTALQPGRSRILRSREAIERAHIDGVKALVDLHDFDSANRVNMTITEGSLVANLTLEVLLDARDLLAECAWRLSELTPDTVKHCDS